MGIHSFYISTAEYLAPEILKEEPYGFEVDWWSLGTFLYELLTGMIKSLIIGLTPFWAEEQVVMYQRVLYDPLIFPDYFPDLNAKTLITGVL